MLNYIFVGVIGILIGYIILPRVFGYGTLQGELQFYKVDGESDPVMTAILYEHPSSISNRKYAIFKISHK